MNQRPRPVSPVRGPLAAQPKAGVGPTVPPAYSPRHNQIQLKTASAPPVYRPENRSSAGRVTAGAPAIQPKRIAPAVPPVYRPQHATHLQPSRAPGSSGDAAGNIQARRASPPP